MQNNILDTSIEYLKGVGPKRAALLKSEIGVHTFRDLLQYYPFRYIDKSKIHRISEINSDLAYVQLKGTISNLKNRQTTCPTAYCHPHRRKRSSRTGLVQRR